MTDDLMQALIGAVPQLSLTIFFLIALILLLKEYAKLRAEIRTTTEEVVKARIGSLIGDIQHESSKAKELREIISDEAQRARELFDELESAYSNQRQELMTAQEEIERRIEFLQQTLPSSAIEVKQPASLLVSTASAAESWVEAFSALQKVREDPDATSRDLEYAGDRARHFSQFTAALDFYKRAQERDPENLSATLEYHCLLAEVSFADRDSSLTAAKEVSLKTLNLNHLRRLANAYIAVGRYENLKILSDEILSQIDGSIRPDLHVFAHRNSAVVMKELNDLGEAEMHLREALEKDPQDEGTVKTLVSVLQDQRRHHEALTEATRLVELDPMDGSYYYILGVILSALGREDEAVAWFERAEPLLPAGGIRLAADLEKRKSTVRASLLPQLQAMRSRSEIVSVTQKTIEELQKNQTRASTTD